jgi:large subunit ribosomal protein L29
MKNTKYINQLKESTEEELAKALVEAKKELFNLRFQNATHQLDNTARIKEVRKNIARIQTFKTQMERAKAQ